MYNPEIRKDCPMRETNGNCSPVGGFCMDAVSDEICEAVHNAYQHGYGNALALLKEQEAVFANLVVDWLREIALNNFDCNRDMTFLDAVEDVRDRASYGLKQYFIDKLEGR